MPAKGKKKVIGRRSWLESTRLVEKERMCDMDAKFEDFDCEGKKDWKSFRLFLLCLFGKFFGLAAA